MPRSQGRVTSKGTKAWTLLFGTPRRRITLGRYPSLGLAGARTLALETKEGRTAGSVAALAEAYLKNIQGNRSASEVERRLRKDVLPVIGHVPLRELHRRDVTRVIDSKASAPISARRAFEDIRGMVRWAVARGDLDHNPIDGMKGPPLSKPRDRVLTDDEIRLLWHGLSETRADMASVLRLCLVTGQRLGERCRREWCWNLVTRSPAFREYPVRRRGQSVDRWALWRASANHQPCAC